MEAYIESSYIYMKAYIEESIYPLVWNVTGCPIDLGVGPEDLLTLLFC